MPTVGFEYQVHTLCVCVWRYCVGVFPSVAWRRIRWRAWPSLVVGALAAPGHPVHAAGPAAAELTRAAIPRPLGRLRDLPTPARRLGDQSV